MTADLLASPAAEGLVIAVFGPDRAAFNALAARYPRQTLKYLEAPMLVPGHLAWRASVDHAAQAQWDVLLACVSFPKQELFAHDLRAAGRETGVTLCVGASVDFRTGRQQRAPRLVQGHGSDEDEKTVKKESDEFAVPALFGTLARKAMSKSQGQSSRKTKSSEEEDGDEKVVCVSFSLNS
jgi:hypothetical protein